MNIQVSLTEDMYARLKSLNLTDTEIVYILATSTNKLQRFKMDMDWMLFNELLERYQNTKHAMKRKGA